MSHKQSFLPNSFSSMLLNWFDKHGRHDLPWQQQDPYIVWLSEVMLQQTQVKTVIPYFNKFITHFPTVEDLAQTEWDDIASLWAGLGYYARARNLHKSAKLLADNGFPNTLEGWMALPGVGQSTAGAILSMGIGKYGVILDGNVKRVLTRCFAIDSDITKSATNKQLWALADKLTPLERNNHYTQAIMDLGATLCTRTKPKCEQCPMNKNCQAFLQGNPTSYPVKPKKKAIPTFHADVFILTYKQQVLWLQRPNSGLWNGLWCLPIINNTVQTKATNSHAWDLCCEALLAHIDKTYADEVTTIKHTFSHYHWMLTAYAYTLTENEFSRLSSLLNAQTFSHKWLNHSEVMDIGIPKAMDKVLKKIN